MDLIARVTGYLFRLKDPADALYSSSSRATDRTSWIARTCPRRRSWTLKQGLTWTGRFLWQIWSRRLADRRSYAESLQGLGVALLCPSVRRRRHFGHVLVVINDDGRMRLARRSRGRDRSGRRRCSSVGRSDMPSGRPRSLRRRPWHLPSAATCEVFWPPCYALASPVLHHPFFHSRRV